MCILSLSIFVNHYTFQGKLSGIPGFMYFCSGFVATMCFLALFGVAETKDSYLSDTIIGSKLGGNEENVDVNEARVETDEGKYSKGRTPNMGKDQSKTLVIESEKNNEESENTNLEFRTTNGKSKMDGSVFNNIKVVIGDSSMANNGFEMASVESRTDVKQSTMDTENVYTINVKSKQLKTNDVGQMYPLQYRL